MWFEYLCLYYVDRTFLPLNTLTSVFEVLRYFFFKFSFEKEIHLKRTTFGFLQKAKVKKKKNYINCIIMFGLNHHCSTHTS